MTKNKKPTNAFDYLTAVHPDRPWVISTLDPANKNAIHTVVFRDDIKAGNGGRHLKSKHDFRDFLKGCDHLNVYYQPNPIRKDAYNLTSKPSGDQIAAVEWLQVDADPQPGQTPEECKEAVLDEIRRVCDSLKIDDVSLIVDSGNGIQFFIKLTQPIPIEGETAEARKAHAIELGGYSKAVAAMVGEDVEIVDGRARSKGDHCHSPAHMMRLPFTWNNPDEKKKAKGRVRVPTALIQLKDTAHPISLFRKAKTGIKLPPNYKGPAFNMNRLNATDLAFPDPSVIQKAAQKTKREDDARLMQIILDGRDHDRPKEGDDSRSAWVFDVVCNLHRIGLKPTDIALCLLNPEWGISESVLEQKNPTAYAARQVARAIERVAGDELAEHEARGEEHAGTLEQMNARFYVLGNEAGKARVLRWEQSKTDPSRNVSRLQTHEDFIKSLRNQFVEDVRDIRGKMVPTQVPLGKWWLDHPDRPNFEATTFDPMDDSPIITRSGIIGDDVHYVNLWRGFRFEPKAGSWGLLQHHMKEHVCGGCEVQFTYLLNWIADTLQNRDRPSGAAVVMRGRKGSGKTIIGKIVSNLLGQHGYTITNASHLTGNFNGHLEDCLFLFADEAIAPTDNKAESILKTLITGDDIALEKKGLDLTHVSNFLSIMMASNHDFVVPATDDERRFAVFDVAHSLPKSQEKRYFDDLFKQLHSGGYEAMLHDLLSRDLTGFHTRHSIPDTKGLQDQKLANLTQIDRWVLGVLQEGYLPGPRPKKVVDSHGNAVMATKRVLDNGREVSGLVEIIRDGVPALSKESNQSITGLLKQNWGAIAKQDSGDRRAYWLFPPLAEMREAFEARFGPMDWNDQTVWIDGEYQDQDDMPF